ncbi:AlpA family transcriptional regulator [Pseudomonas sp. WS 5079]|uniref:helix-turn-helix transcriptional regulator n=1 Tax=Pseudomonas sp. WS 5079 TaxID=2717492 RepID=UPI00155699BB|nr:AlpA family transcriptional regulator [Pseudomonas sp. WS 5079]NMX61508.1 AlpA family transcriptional regulator [Pseudomonas sp. WS 5079]
MNTARTDTPPETHIEYIKLPEVRRICGLSTPTIYRLAVAGKFPKQVKLGVKSVAWIRAEVDQWAASKAAARGDQAPAATESK